MWNSIFTLEPTIWEKLLRTIILYAFLVIALRLSGKRLMAQLTTFDFIVLLLVSNAVQNGLIGNDNSVTGAIIGAAALFILNGAIAYLFVRSRRAQEIVSGKGALLVKDGVVDRKALRRQRFTDSDLMVALQDSGVTAVADVKTAQLEPNGQLLVARLDDDAPSTTELLAAVRRVEDKLDELLGRGASSE